MGKSLKCFREETDVIQSLCTDNHALPPRSRAAAAAQMKDNGGLGQGAEDGRRADPLNSST